jgi:methionine aminopeptidase
MRTVCRVGAYRHGRWRLLIPNLIPFISQLAREVLDIAASHIRPGVTTDEIDAVVHQACIERNAYPSPLNYRHFPKSVCT